MKVDKGRKLFVRSLVLTTASTVPYFWPMRNFIHHNPLYGLEHLPFEKALEVGKRLFHGRVFLSGEIYRKFLKEGKIEERFLKEEIRKFIKERGFGEREERLFLSYLLYGDGVGETYPGIEELSRQLKDMWVLRLKEIPERLSRSVGRTMTVYEVVDSLFGTRVGKTIDDSLIKLCASFLDEGQAVWGMPYREKSLYGAWREFMGGKEFPQDPEEVILLAFERFGIGEEIQEDYVLRELSRLHGWAGFMRWRSSVREYYWQVRYPADLVDYLAVRLALSMNLLERERELPVEAKVDNLVEFIRENPEEALLRWEFFSGKCPPGMAFEVERSILEGELRYDLFTRYIEERAISESRRTASSLLSVWKGAGLDVKELVGMGKEELLVLVSFLEEFAQKEGFIWLRAHERTKMEKLLGSVSLHKKEKREAFAQALFCIDVRSERFRRNLERVGDYETYGIAGFFGVPISFIELGKGHETYLCPVLIKPKNVVMETYRDLHKEEESIKKVLKEILHDLKNNVLTPYITVEAIGLLFGFDMVGKTFFPLGYSSFREKLEEKKPSSRLLIDKLSREEVLDIVGLLQREIITRALKDRFGIEGLGEETIERLRLVALEEIHHEDVRRELGVDEETFGEIISTLRKEYHVEKGYTRIQVEKLGKIGFTLEEQVFFVERALRSIGLTENFGRFVFVIGHGSKSDNNPYESALDCGACGGDHGAVNAIVFSLMANKREVRDRLREIGIEIPPETVFVPCEHNTTTDEIEILSTEMVPPHYIPFLERAISDFRKAGALVAFERCGELPNLRCEEMDTAVRNVKRNSVDWTQVRPEWGLSGNYAFVIARRELTASADLGGKVFLHSYEWEKDPKGTLLEVILSGPLIVGEWINMEHYFSTVDNDTFGSGSKVYHNVVGRFGVMYGNQSDLRTGLPAQTVLRGSLPFHEPVRLITLIEAPLDRVERVIGKIKKLRELVYGRWINLIVLDPDSRSFFLYEDEGWRKLEV